MLTPTGKARLVWQNTTGVAVHAHTYRENTTGVAVHAHADRGNTTSVAVCTLTPTGKVHGVTVHAHTYRESTTGVAVCMLHLQGNPLKHNTKLLSRDRFHVTAR